MVNRPQPTGGFAWVQAGARAALVCRALEPFAAHLFTARDWTLGSAADGNTAEGWGEVASAIGVPPADLLRVHQVHGADAIVLRGPTEVGRHAQPGRHDPRRERPRGDIILSDAAEAALAVQTADCIPLLIADRRGGAYAAAHAGWRGLAARVPDATVRGLCREFGSRPEDLVAVIGPSIGACCYEVGADVREAFGGFGERDRAGWFHDGPRPTAANRSMPGLPAVRRPDHWYFDGWAAARHQLEAAGVPVEQIHVVALCTASHPDVFPSYRRDGKSAGRIAGVIRRCADGVPS